MSWCFQGRNPKSSRGHAFTLVELLVVIGIIAIMIGILLPTLNKAREAARASKCLNNMRQITIAIINFAQENNGWMPGRGGSNILPFNPAPGKNPFVGTADIQAPGDWIAWQRVNDPMGGPGNGADQNITYSVLAKYLNSKPRVHATPADANSIAPNLDDLYRCPSDNLASRPATPAPGDKKYRYSYAVNDLFFNPVQKADPTDYTTVPPGGLLTGQRNGFFFSGKISSIRTPAEKVMIVCQDEQRIDDGIFKPNSAKWVANDPGDAVAARHESKFKKQVVTSGVGTNQNARGNVGFCDGHAEFMSRKDAISQKYSGHPLPDPAGF